MGISELNCPELEKRFEMDPLSIVGAVLGLNSIYHNKRARVLPTKKPFLSFMPKFVAAISYASDILEAENSLAILDERLATIGFEQESQDANSVTFVRGMFLGDISTKVAKMRLIFDRPLNAGANVVIEYAAFSVFDTGDLWTLTTKLKELLEEPPPKPPLELRNM